MSDDDELDSVIVKITLDDLFHLNIEGFQDYMDETIDGGFMSGWSAEVEDVEDNTTLLIRVHGIIERYA